jgi:exopolysaccharide biosynthesis polyprenyl glycosylphosphotransferase
LAQIFRKLILILGDLLCIQIATFIAIYMQSDSMCSMQIDFHIRLTVLLSVFLIFFFNIHGLFSLIRKRLSEIFLNLVVAVGNIFIAAMAVTFFLRDFEYSRMVIIYSAVFGFMLLALWQYVMHQIEVNHLPIPTVFVAADSEEQEKLKTKIRKTYGLEKSNLKFISTDNNGNNTNINLNNRSNNENNNVSNKDNNNNNNNTGNTGKNIFNTDINETDTIKQIEACDIVLIGESLSVEIKEHILRLANKKKKMVILVPTLYEISCSKMYLWQIDDLPTQRVSRMLLTLEQRILKRTLDIVVSVIALILLSPVMLVTAVIVKLDSPGPIIYSQVRVGRFGKEFKVHKIRSMRQDAEAKTGPVLAGENDPRITKFGRFMRATRLDELPQLINVLKGEMSIVGPRPERPFFVEQFIKEKPEYAYRHNVKPGITGLAQIAGKYNTTAYDKLVYDLIYIQNVSITYDLTLMLQTLKVLITKESTEGVK